MKNELNLNETEVFVVNKVIAELVDGVVGRVARVINNLEDVNFEDVIARNSAGAQDGQKNIDELMNIKLVHDNDPWGAEHCLLDAILGSLSNTDRAICGIVIRRAMEEDSRVDQWIRSIIIGAKVCDALKVASEGETILAKQGEHLEKMITG